jgi:uncharacterized protein YukE
MFFTRPPKPSPDDLARRGVQSFLVSLRLRWSSLPPLPDGSPETMGAALGEYLSRRDADHRHLQWALQRCQAEQERLRENWQDCLAAPLRTQLAETRDELQETLDALKDCRKQVEHARRLAARLEDEIEQLQAQVAEQQTVIARQQIRLLELEGLDAEMNG